MSEPTTARTLSAFLAAIARHLAGAVCGFVLIPLLARVLGEESLGAWALLGTASFVMGASDLGQGARVQRAVARAGTSGGEDEVRRAVALALSAVAIAAPLFALALGWLVVPTLPRAMLSAALVSLLAGWVGAVAVPYRSFLLVRDGMGQLAAARAAASMAQLLLTAGLLGVSRTLLAPAVALLVGAAVETGWTVRAARAIDGALPLWPVRPRSRRELKRALSEGSATLVINVAFLAALRADVLVIARAETLVRVAAYGVASRAVDQAYVLAKQVSAAALPRLAGSETRAQATRLGTWVMGALVASGMPALALCGGRLLEAWAGPSAAAPLCSTATALLGLAAIVAAAQEVAAAAIAVGAETPWRAARALLVGTAMNVLLSIVGARLVGAEAVAAATIVGNATTALLVWRSASELLGWSRADVLSALRPLPIALVASTLAGLALASLSARSLPASAAAAALAMSAGLAAAALGSGLPIPLLRGASARRHRT